jgi:two-component system OmpR family response regulator
MRIAVVEDNVSLADGLAIALRDEGHSVDVLNSGGRAAAFLLGEAPDLVILDVNLPGCSGLQIVNELRAHGMSVPVLMLTARGEAADKIAGLDAGADDYLAKPFDLDELKARVRALLRRAGQQRLGLLKAGAIEFDPGARSVHIDGKSVRLPARELALLELLMRCQGDVLSKARLLDHVYGVSGDAADSAIELYVHRLRKRIAGSGVEISTLRGLGYCLRADD